MRLGFRKKALLLILPILGLVSLVYTYEAIRTEKEIAQTEIIKRAEAITKLATKTGELPVLSENQELLGNTVSSLRDNPEVTSVAFFDSRMNLLIHEGTPLSGPFPALSAEAPLSMSERKDVYIFYAPIFTVRPRNEVDIYQEGNKSGLSREVIGWVRLDFSKAPMINAVRKLVVRGSILAVLFTFGSSIALFFLINLATKPLMVLFHAARKIERGEYPEISDISSADEIGELGSAFNKMSAAVKERESRLIESENRIRQLFDRVEHAIFRLDAEGAIVEVNSRFRDMFGDPHDLADIIGGKDRMRDCFRKAAERKAVDMEEKVRGKDASEMTVLLSLYPETDGQNELKGYDGYLIDITEKKVLEDRLLRSQKLEAVGTLAGGIAHDFNNLLQAILGYSEMMMKTMAKENPLCGPISIIHTSAKRGAALTRSILSATRKEKLERKAVALNDIVRNSVELLRSSIPKNITIETYLDEGMPVVMADPSQMQQVILNLGVNARDAMPDGGTLTIRTETMRQEDVPQGSSDAGGEGYIKLSVSDDGTGMDRETEKRIFDPFFTTKEAGKGTGLGLYIVHSIMTNHGGYVSLSSEQGKGTHFAVYLPIVRGEYSETSHAADDLRGTETLLVIDDEKLLRNMCEEMLTPLGYEVLLAEGPEEGIAMFRRMKDRISVVILDMIMPKMGGTEVFSILRDIKPEVKVLLCSGYSQSGYEAIKRLLAEGASGFLQKPFICRDLALSLRKVLSKKGEKV